MPINKEALIDAIRNSGGKDQPLAEVDEFWPKLELLQNTGRYGPLISQLAAANDKSNFLALVLEANFAYQFESQGLHLAYEVTQEPTKPSTVDFVRQTPAGKRAYLELRLLQQRKSIKDMIDEQLQKYGIYKV